MDATTPEEKGLIVPPKAIETTPESVHRNASWGAIISILIILAMVVVGAFYAWGKRVAEEHSATSFSATPTTHKT